MQQQQQQHVSHHDPNAGLSPWTKMEERSGRLGSPLPAIVHWELEGGKKESNQGILSQVIEE